MISFKISKRVIQLTLCLSLTACADFENLTMSREQNIKLTPLQNCAIGYDLAKQIYDRVVLSKTIIVPGRRQSECEKYTLEYLKRVGFIIDEQADIPAMTVTLTAGEDGGVYAVANVGGRLRLGRLYQPASEGVYPKSGVTFFQVPSDATLNRSRITSRSAPSSVEKAQP